MMSIPSPHGGVLIDRMAPQGKRTELEKKAHTLKGIRLNTREISDLEMIAVGALSPLEGFMGRESYQSVLKQKRLPSGIPWTIPITLSAGDDEASGLKEREDCALLDPAGNPVGILHLVDKYSYDKEAEARVVFRTTDRRHPGVDYLMNQGGTLLGGNVTLFRRSQQNDFHRYRLDPSETRALFAHKGWNSVVGFQTRNPIHRAHEYLQKCSLEIADGLFIHPIVGDTKNDDIPASVRMKCYEVLLEHYYPRDRVVLAVNPAAMRYAGPSEAIFHAIIRKNYGCTHFIVGRDHAGVGNFYGPFDAQKIFDEFDRDELGIIPLFYDNAFFCRACGGMATEKTCPHGSEDRVVLSGTKVREMLKKGEIPPLEFTRPEVARILLHGSKP